MTDALSRPVDVAIAAHDAGLSVVPPRQDGSKRPDGTWLRFQTERADPAQIERWYANGRTGVGILTGAVSGNLEMLEFEGRARDQWHAFVAACRDAALGDVIDRVVNGYAEITPSGGIHLLYRCDEIEGNRKLARRPATPDELETEPDDKVQTLIETRGEGGFVIVAPSHGTVHPTGQPWELRSGSFATIATITAEERAALFIIAERFDEMPPTIEPSTDDTPPAIEPVGNEIWAEFRAPHADPWITDVIADFNQRTTWDEILAGWTRHHTDNDGITYWTRPGKDPRHGWSATTNSRGTDRLIVFSSSTEGFDTYTGGGLATSYDRFSADAILNHQSDRVAAARRHRDNGYGPPPANATADPAAAPNVAPLYQPIDWHAFWNREHIGEDWLAEPLLPRGRQVALWATHKTGKSLLSLEVAAALATGRPCLNQPPQAPLSVMYVDLEMTEDDLYERLADMGYGPTIDLAHLHYYLLPALPPLDRVEGGIAVVQLAIHHQAQLVVIDTMARAVAGEENDADTYRDFYRYTGLHLKARGISLMRLDHGGKDPTRGQRGSSGKGDDVDVVWQLRATDDGLALRRDVSRMSWVPESVALQRQEDPLRHEVAGGFWPAGTKEVAAALDELGVDVNASQRAATEVLRAANKGRQAAVIRAAIRWRKQDHEQRSQTSWIEGENHA